MEPKQQTVFTPFFLVVAFAACNGDGNKAKTADLSLNAHAQLVQAQQLLGQKPAGYSDALVARPVAPSDNLPSARARNATTIEEAGIAEEGDRKFRSAPLANLPAAAQVWSPEEQAKRDLTMNLQAQYLLEWNEKARTLNGLGADELEHERSTLKAKIFSQAKD